MEVGTIAQKPGPERGLSSPSVWLQPLRSAPTDFVVLSAKCVSHVGSLGEHFVLLRIYEYLPIAKHLAKSADVFEAYFVHYIVCNMSTFMKSVLIGAALSTLSFALPAVDKEARDVDTRYVAMRN